MRRSDKMLLTALVAEAAGTLLLRYADYKLAQLGMSRPMGVPFCKEPGYI